MFSQTQHFVACYRYVSNTSGWRALNYMCISYYKGQESFEILVICCIRYQMTAASHFKIKIAPQFCCLKEILSRYCLQSASVVIYRVILSLETTNYCL